MHCWIQSTNDDDDDKRKNLSSIFSTIFCCLTILFGLKPITSPNESKRIAKRSKDVCMFEGWIRWITRKIKFLNQIQLNWIEIHYSFHFFSRTMFLFSHTECISSNKVKSTNKYSSCLLEMSVRLIFGPSSVNGHSVQISNVGLLLLCHHSHLIFFYPIKRSGHLVKHSYARTHQKLSFPLSFQPLGREREREGKKIL